MLSDLWDDHDVGALPLACASQARMCDWPKYQGKKAQDCCKCWKVGLYRFGVDVSALEGNVVTECFRQWFDRNGVDLTESEVRVRCRRVSVGSCVVDHHSEQDGLFMYEALHSPGLLRGLPGRWGDVDHFLAAPRAS